MYSIRIIQISSFLFCTVLNAMESPKSLGNMVIIDNYKSTVVSSGSLNELPADIKKSILYSVIKNTQYLTENVQDFFNAWDSIKACMSMHRSFSPLLRDAQFNGLVLQEFVKKYSKIFSSSSAEWLKLLFYAAFYWGTPGALEWMESYIHGDPEVLKKIDGLIPDFLAPQNYLLSSKQRCVREAFLKKLNLTFDSSNTMVIHDQRFLSEDNENAVLQSRRYHIQDVLEYFPDVALKIRVKDNDIVLALESSCR